MWKWDLPIVKLDFEECEIENNDLCRMNLWEGFGYDTFDSFRHLGLKKAKDVQILATVQNDSNVSSWIFENLAFSMAMDA